MPYQLWCEKTVAPLVGAWIEINTLWTPIAPTIVAPLVGAWIEIDPSCAMWCSPIVAPLVGAWIEIANT